MKRRELERRLRDLGWRFQRHGGKHDVWCNGDGSFTENVPRHAEINERLEGDPEASEGETMRFEGQVAKDGRFWLVEVPAFDALTQGRTKREAYEMVKDLIETMANTRGFEVTVYPKGKDSFEVGANRTGVLVALLLRRQRERQGLSLAEAAQRLGQRSRNAYARYEQGTTMPTIEKLEQLLEAIAPDQRIVWRIAA